MNENKERTKQLLAQKKNPILFSSKPTNNNGQNTDKRIKETPKKSNWDTASKSSVTFESNKETATKRSPYSRRKNDTQPEIRKVPKEKVNYRPSDDIFSREIKRNETSDEGIPLIKNNNINRQKESSQITKHRDDVFPKLELNKEKDIFPKLEPQNNDSFFDDDEFKDLNKYMENDKKNSWF